MKKIIILIALLIFIAGCAQDDVKVVKVGSDGVKTITPSETPSQGAAGQPNQTETSAPQQITETPSGNSVPTKADLGISGLYLSSLNVDPNEEFEVKFKITNSGSAPIKNFEYSIKAMKGTDIAKVSTFNYTEEIAAGSESDKLEVIFYISDIGSYDIIVKMDPFNALEEPNENNNEGKQRVNVIVVTKGNSSSTVQTTRTTTSNPTSSSNSSSESLSGCVDTDGGKVYGVRGTCTDTFGNNVKDVCLEVNQIWEWSCGTGGRCTPETHTCTCDEDAGVCK